jgi:hypothetical protein
MAVRAADLALVDLDFDTEPAAAATRVGCNVAKFFGDMVKLEDDDIGFAAVDTGVLLQVLDDFLADFRAPLRDLAYEPALLPFVILPIVPSARLGEAVPAPRLELRLTPPHRRKRFERLHLAAFRARSHEGERADRSLSCE